MSVIDKRKTHLINVKQQFIVDTTLDLIAEIGIHNINMDAIAKAANYTKRTLYSYFKSKDEILLRVFTQDLNLRWRIQKKEIKNELSGIDKLSKWAISLYNYCEENRQCIQIQSFMDYNFVQIQNISDSVFKDFESINNELFEGLRVIFKLGVTDGSFRKDLDIDLTINQFLYSFRAILNRAFKESSSLAPIEKSKYIDHYLTLFIRGIKK